MTFTVESVALADVTLPRDPEKVQFKKAAEIKSYMFPGALPLLISFGGKADILIVEGKLQEAGKTKAQLVTDYISPLELLVYTEVTIQFAGRSYHNTDFILANFTHDERPGWKRAFYTRLEFWKGSTHTVL